MTRAPHPSAHPEYARLRADPALRSALPTARHRPADQIVKLDANENPYGVLPVVTQALAGMPFAHIYPDPESRALRSALSAYHGLPADNILAGAGADELIDLILRLVIEPGDTIVNCPPTFGMYAFDADLNAAGVVQVPRRSDFSLDIAAIEQAVITHNPKLIFLASPNNPDGSLAPRPQVERLLSLPVLVVLDEAYIEFAGPGSSLLTEVPARQNLVVLRTFSKWAGLAGLRIGFGAFPSAAHAPFVEDQATLQGLRSRLYRRHPLFAARRPAHGNRREDRRRATAPVPRARKVGLAAALSFAGQLSCCAGWSAGMLSI